MNEVPQTIPTGQDGRFKKVVFDTLIFLLPFLWSFAIILFLKAAIAPLTVFVNLSFYPLLLIGTAILLAFAFAIVKNVLKKEHGGITAGILLALIVFLPNLVIVARAIMQNGLAGEAFAVVPFTLIAFVPVLLWGVVIGIIQESLVRLWNVTKTRNTQYIKIGIIIVTMPILAWLIIFFGRTSQAITTGCPQFQTNIQSLAFGADDCISKAAVAQQNTGVCKLILAKYNREICETKSANIIINFTVPVIGIQFRYPSGWGKASFEERQGVNGKKFNINFCCYGGLQEFEEMGIAIGGATKELEKTIFGSSGTEFYDFDENACRLLTAKAYINAIQRPVFGCSDLVEKWQTPVGDVFYYRKANEGIGIIRLSNSDYKIMTARKRINVPEKEVEFTNFLRSFDKL